MSLRDHWLHDSGGLIWHGRALRWRNTLWAPFRHTVADWLQTWDAPRDQLLIIGPSAGYTLDADWLRSWRDVTACEPDPLARHLLQRRMARDIHFSRVDVFAPDGLQRVAREFPDHTVLFSNVLGQCAPRDATSAKWYAGLHEALKKHNWASYHDVVSTTRPPNQTQPLIDSPSLETAIAHFWQGGELEITDHGSFGLGRPDGEYRQEKSPLSERAFAVWQLRPDQHHLVEWLSHAPD